MADLLTLEALSERLGNIPLSTLKHRIAQLGIVPTARGSRNKLLFDDRAAALIEASDVLIKQGNGIHSIRRRLGLDGGAGDDEAPPGDGPNDEPPPPGPPASLDESLARLSETLAYALAQIEEKDRQAERLNIELRRAQEAAATFQQKTFYLQSELQRLQGDLRDARAKEAKAWLKRLWQAWTPGKPKGP